MTKTRINISTLANVNGARKEKRNGRSVIVVPSATLPDDIVMNGILYPAKEIEKGYKTLERTPAPFGHPVTTNGEFLSASDPEGINSSWVGAWNENVRRKDGRVLLDKVIDVEVAGTTENGRKLLQAIKKKQPIHTSTALYYTKGQDEKGNPIAENMLFDHDAILLNKRGAATPEQGVGIYVNSEGAQEDVKCLFANLEEVPWGNPADESIRGVVASTVEAILANLFQAKTKTQTETNEMSDNDKQFESMNTELGKMSTKLDGLAKEIGTALADALKPVTDAVSNMAKAAEVEREAEKASLVAKVVRANMLDEAEAKEASMALLKSLAGRVSKDGKAQGLNARKGEEDKDHGLGDYKMNSHLDKEKQKDKV